MRFFRVLSRDRADSVVDIFSEKRLSHPDRTMVPLLGLVNIETSDCDGCTNRRRIARGAVHDVCTVSTKYSMFEDCQEGSLQSFFENESESSSLPLRRTKPLRAERR